MEGSCVVLTFVSVLYQADTDLNQTIVTEILRQEPRLGLKKRLATIWLNLL